jgi:hypothetical protein
MKDVADAAAGPRTAIMASVTGAGVFTYWSLKAFAPPVITVLRRPHAPSGIGSQPAPWKDRAAQRRHVDAVGRRRDVAGDLVQEAYGARRLVERARVRAPALRCLQQPVVGGVVQLVAVGPCPYLVLQAWRHVIQRGLDLVQVRDRVLDRADVTEMAARHTALIDAEVDGRAWVAARADGIW